MKGTSLRKSLLILIAVLAGIQFFPVERTNPPVTGDLGAEPEVDVLLRDACYDCHSHETKWPAYAHVAPISWFLIRHVSEGRKELNFSTWESMPEDRKDRKLEEIAELVENHSMPLASYVRLHPEARLTDAQRTRIVAWANAMRESLQYPVEIDQAGTSPEVAVAE
jgi:hypothetical protein